MVSNLMFLYIIPQIIFETLHSFAQRFYEIRIQISRENMIDFFQQVKGNTFPDFPRKFNRPPPPFNKFWQNAPVYSAL